MTPNGVDFSGFVFSRELRQMISGCRQSRDLLDCAAANMDMTPKELLAPTPVTDLLKDVMSFSHGGPAVQEEPMPAFTTRSATAATCSLLMTKVVQTIHP